MPNRFLVCNIEHYTLEKNIKLFENGKEVESVNCENIDKITKILYNICKDKEVKDIYIRSGCSDFAKKIVEEIHELEISEFNKKEIKINII